MVKCTITLLTVSIGCLLAQENFLQGVRAEGLMLDRTDAITSEIKKEIEEKGIDYWFLSTGDRIYSRDRTLIAEERKEKTSGKSLGLWVVDTKEKSETQITPSIVSSMEWSADNKYLAYVQYEFIPDPKLAKRSRKPAFNSERLCIYNHQSGEISSIVAMKGYAIKHKWSPVGNRLAYTYVDHELERYILMVFDVESNKMYQIDEILLCDLWNFDWAPNGEMLVYAKPLEIDRLVNEEVPLKSDIFLANYDSGDKMQLTISSEAELFVRWLPDGMHIISELVQEPINGYDPIYRSLVLQKKELK
ncbi:MAG: hypothetical protein WBB37_12385 [bacterium]